MVSRENNWDLNVYQLLNQREICGFAAQRPVQRSICTVERLNIVLLKDYFTYYYEIWNSNRHEHGSCWFKLFVLVVKMESCTLGSPQTSWAGTQHFSEALAAVMSSELSSTTPPGCRVSGKKQTARDQCKKNRHNLEKLAISHGERPSRNPCLSLSTFFKQSPSK